MGARRGNLAERHKGPDDHAQNDRPFHLIGVFPELRNHTPTYPRNR